MATAFKGILKVRFANGATRMYPVTMSDVTTQSYIFPDGTGDINIPSGSGACQLFDVILSAAGADTTQAKVFVNGLDTGVVILNAANLGTNNSRQFAGTPINIEAGAKLKIVQYT